MAKESSLSGESLDTAIVICADNSGDGVGRENRHLSRLFGRRGIDWEMLGQALIERDDRCFDRIRVEVGARIVDVYFDITSFLSPRHLQP